MHLIVTFSRYDRPPGAKPSARTSHECGPFRSVVIDGDKVLAAEWLDEQFVLATQAADGLWDVHGLEGIRFRSMMVHLPPDQQAAALTADADRVIRQLRDDRREPWQGDADEDDDPDGDR